MKVCVFAGARGGAELMSDNRLIGAELAKRGCQVYYGGSRKGVMGAVADGFKAWHLTHRPTTDDSGIPDGWVDMIGVLPETIHRLGHFDPDVSNIITSDMPSRKLYFWQCDAFLCLPGGAGTMDELFEIWTETKLGHQKARPIVVFNQGGFYNGLLELIRRMHWSGTMPADRVNLVKFVNQPIEAVNALFSTQEGTYTNEVVALAREAGSVQGSEGGQGRVGDAGTEQDRPATD